MKFSGGGGVFIEKLGHKPVHFDPWKKKHLFYSFFKQEEEPEVPPSPYFTLLLTIVQNKQFYSAPRPNLSLLPLRGREGNLPRTASEPHFTYS